MSTANKKQAVRKQISDRHKCNGVCAKCIKAYGLIDQMAEANIPAEYWLSKPDNSSVFDNLNAFVRNYTNDMAVNYAAGKSICFIGSHGVGKTHSACSILKFALKNDFIVYYTSATDMMNDVIKNSLHRTKLKGVDFLVIDELDSRFFTSRAQKELFGGVYESIFRNRCQNLLPTIMCSNETNNLFNVFGEQTAQSISSLYKQYVETKYVAGIDIRKRIEK